MELLKTRTCSRCKASVPLASMRLYPKDKETSILLCEKCGQELKKKSIPKVSQKISPLPKPDLVKYFCNRCKYSFQADKGKAGLLYNLHCPYCGKPDRLEKR